MLSFSALLPTKQFQNELVDILYYLFCFVGGIALFVGIAYVTVNFYEIAIPTLSSIALYMISVKPKS